MGNDKHIDTLDSLVDAISNPATENRTIPAPH